MKNLVSIQSTAVASAAAKKYTCMELHKTKSKAVRSNRSTKSTISVPLNQLILRNRSNPFVHVKKLNLSRELLLSSKSARSIRTKPSAAVTAAAASCAMSPPSSKPFPTLTAKSRIAPNKSKSSKVINIVALAQEKRGGGGGGFSTFSGNFSANAATVGGGRKRKYSNDLTLTAEIADEGGRGPTLRKSARLSKDCEIIKFTGAKRIIITPSTSYSYDKVGGIVRQRRQSTISRKRTHTGDARPEPPLTRSRLKQMSHGTLNPALEFRHRAV